jgi:hypothetical protein
MTRIPIIDKLSAGRVRAIIEAYGAEPRRWPADERAAAMTYVAQNPERVAPWLAEARQLDAMLDVLPIAETIDAEDVGSVHWRLLAHIAPDSLEDVEFDDEVEALPSAEIVPFAAKPRAPKPMPVLWATGIGLAACIAGAIFGVNLSLSSLGDARMQTVLEQTQLVDAEF